MVRFVGRILASTVKCTFAKTFLTSKQHLEKLKQQGLIVADDSSAIRYISFVGHFRLKGYWYQLQNPSLVFKSGYL